MKNQEQDIVKAEVVDEATMEKVEKAPVLKDFEKLEYIEGADISLFGANLEQLTYEKMFILFQRLQPALNDLKQAQISLENTRDKILLETDFKKELNENRPTIAMKEAYMKPLIAAYENKVEEHEETVEYYKNKITIINDLIRNARLMLKIEVALNEQ